MLLLDKILEFFKPKNKNKRGFNAGSVSGRVKNWRPHLDYAKFIAREHLTTIISRSRDLVNNNPFAKNSMRIICNNVIRDGIKPKFKSSNRKTEKFIEWANNIELDDLQHLVMKTIFQSGSVLIRRIKKRHNNSNIPLSFQIMEPEWINLDKHEIVEPNGNRIIAGKEYTQNNELVAYHLYDNHPQNQLDYYYKTVRVPASEILHIYVVDRPDQIHGMPFLTNCLFRLHQFDEYQDAKLEQQKVAACFAIFTKGVEDVNLGLDNSAEYDVDKVTPGMIAHLGTNDIVVANPPNANEGDSYSKSVIREISSSLGITYEQLTGDYSQVNFSSARMARIEFRANVKDWQNLIIKQFLNKIYSWYKEAAWLVNIQTENEIQWTGANVPAVDLEQQAKAYREMIRDGLITQSDALAELGKDPDKFYKEFSNDLKTLDTEKIILDTDPRKTARGGTLNTSENEVTNNNE